jgi:hypothetical protein
MIDMLLPYHPAAKADASTLPYTQEFSQIFKVSRPVTPNHLAAGVHSSTCSD